MELYRCREVAGGEERGREMRTEDPVGGNRDSL